MADCVAPAEAQERAMARFGEPRAIARQYAPGALLNQTRRVGTVVLVALVGISFTMKGRAAWYGLMEWAISDELKAIGAIGFSVDYVAFLLAVGLAIVSWFYIGSCRAPGEFRDDYGRQLMRCGLLCAATALALVTVVGADSLMTGLRLYGRDPSAAVVIPLVSMAAEVTFAIVLVRAIWTALRRVAIAATLLHPSSID
jgi:hypothetical protein